MKKILILFFIQTFITPCFAECVAVSRSSLPKNIPETQILLQTDGSNQAYLQCDGPGESFYYCRNGTWSAGADGLIHECKNKKWHVIDPSQIRECKNIEEAFQYYDVSATNLIAEEKQLDWIFMFDSEVWYKIDKSKICKYRYTDFKNAEDDCIQRGGDFFGSGTNEAPCDMSNTNNFVFIVQDTEGNALSDVEFRTPDLYNLSNQRNMATVVANGYQLPINKYSWLAYENLEISKPGYVIQTMKISSNFFNSPGVLTIILESDGSNQIHEPLLASNSSGSASQNNLPLHQPPLPPISPRSISVVQLQNGEELENHTPETKIQGSLFYTETHATPIPVQPIGAPAEPPQPQPETSVQPTAPATPDKATTHADVDAAYTHLSSLLKNTSVWRDENGDFNKARLASDGIASVVLGTVGGIVTATLVKKAQIKQGFEDIQCYIGGQQIGTYGDEIKYGH